ncbi:hypothetical protein K2P56_02180 [Patescibacteria group bacterium]|nr:hypothetical protein [Patescibacteria group bacterium]
MSWFSESIVRQSEKNGTITAIRKFGSWQVSVDGIEQTGSEVHAMWKYALEVLTRYRGTQRIKKILLLGLGGGGELKMISRVFPEATLTVVEHDPEMIALAKELKLYAPYPFPTMICDDAKNAVQKIQEEFDLIVIDLFRGQQPSLLSADVEFLTVVHQRLSPQGYLLANVYKNKELFIPIRTVFHSLREWLFSWNYVGLFQRGTVEKCATDGYRPLRQWPDLNTFESIPRYFHPARIGEKPRGSYWNLWPFSFEQYEGDHEPEVLPLSHDKKKPVRLVMWQRMGRLDVPKKWIAFSDKPAYKIGFIPLTAEYWREWSETGKRDRKRFASECADTYSLEETDFDEFRKAYSKSTLPLTLKDGMLYEMDFRRKNPKTKMTFLVARRKRDGKILAGVAHLRSSALPLSYYQGGFFLPEVRDEPLMTGLFDKWFKESFASGVRFIDLGNFWKQGEDSSWKGFSTFKAKFNPIYFFLPPTLYQFRIGNDR